MTHDQVEALTFADRVVVMTRGRAVQVGTPGELFERPEHAFVGHFIGSPGMNFLQAQARGGELHVAGLRVAAARALPDGDLRVGVRPEYLSMVEQGHGGALPGVVVRVQDVGTHQMLTADINGQIVKARCTPEQVLPAAGETVWLRVIGEHTCFYNTNEELMP
ncbi:sn-glycerol-3-phosphate import ATP-binding protein UgpC [bioreactor metagenome]|uniref:sn-glycerol-3-phosphate import ATP-binding protein UgpC n=1 Tax=bioreactor metagenome TaxID=1076179 RepID=A0A644ZCE2_9ZZZZ